MASGGAEEIVAEAIAGRRDEVFLVSKVLPQNASRAGHHRRLRAQPEAARDRPHRSLPAALARRPCRWPKRSPALRWRCRQAGKIRHWGVSNFDAGDMAELWRCPGGGAVATNQVLYNLTRRGIECELLPWCRASAHPDHGLFADRAGPAARTTTQLVASPRRHGMTPAQAALAWLLAQDDVIVIPKTSRPERLNENLAALDRALTPDELAELDRLFPPPQAGAPLEML